MSYRRSKDTAADGYSRPTRLDSPSRDVSDPAPGRARSRDRDPLPSSVLFPSDAARDATVARGSAATGAGAAAADDDDDAVAPSFGEVVAGASDSTARITREKERDPHRLEQRLKQIQIGKNTPAYSRYLSQVPRASRDPALRLTTHPTTPPHWVKMSKRAFDGQINVWRRQLHFYDPPVTMADREKEEQERDARRAAAAAAKAEAKARDAAAAEAARDAAAAAQCSSDSANPGADDASATATAAQTATAEGKSADGAAGEDKSKVAEPKLSAAGLTIGESLGYQHIDWTNTEGLYDD